MSSHSVPDELLEDEEEEDCGGSLAGGEYGAFNDADFAVTACLGTSGNSNAHCSISPVSSLHRFIACRMRVAREGHVIASGEIPAERILSRST